MLSQDEKDRKRQDELLRKQELKLLAEQEDESLTTSTKSNVPTKITKYQLQVSYHVFVNQTYFSW